MLKYEQLVLGELETNCYLLWDEETKETLIIDPADSGEMISEIVELRGLRPRVIGLTHGHFDHCLAAMYLKLIYNIPIAANQKDIDILKRTKKTAGKFLRHENDTLDVNKIEIDLGLIDKIDLGGERVEIVRTPGHTPGSVCFYARESGWLFSGDTLFGDGSVGSTEHRYSSKAELQKSIDKLEKLPEETIILSGHGGAGVLANLQLWWH